MTENVVISHVDRTLPADRSPPGTKIADVGDSTEIRITIERGQAERKLFGLPLIADGAGHGLPVVFRPKTAALRLGTAEAPFSIAGLLPGEDITVRMFIDRHLVGVFVNDRQAIAGHYPGYAGRTAVHAFSIGAPTALRMVETWSIRPTNQGFRAAQVNRVWEPRTH